MPKGSARFENQARDESAKEAAEPRGDALGNGETEATVEAARASVRVAALSAVTAVSPLREAAVDDASGYVSGVYLVEPAVTPGHRTNDAHDEHDDATSKRGKRMILEHVTLVVYGWKNVEPGTLSWVFPSVGTAVAAARAMKNAVRWAIVAGRGDLPHDLAEARAHGAVLVEEAG